MPIRPENRARYPKDWKAISARIRFERAGGQCECAGECGKHPPGVRCEGRHGHPNPRTRRIITLTVAHLDHTPENCGDDNLKAMCNACHLAYDAEHHAANARRTREERRRRVMDKAGQLAFGTACFGPVAPK